MATFSKLSNELVLNVLEQCDDWHTTLALAATNKAYKALVSGDMRCNYTLVLAKQGMEDGGTSSHWPLPRRLQGIIQYSAASAHPDRYTDDVRTLVEDLNTRFLSARGDVVVAVDRKPRILIWRLADPLRDVHQMCLTPEKGRRLITTKAAEEMGRRYPDPHLVTDALEHCLIDPANDLLVLVFTSRRDPWT